MAKYRLAPPPMISAATPPTTAQVGTDQSPAVSIAKCSAAGVAFSVRPSCGYSSLNGSRSSSGESRNCSDRRAVEAQARGRAKVVRRPLAAGLLQRPPREDGHASLDLIRGGDFLGALGHVNGLTGADRDGRVEDDDADLGAGRWYRPRLGAKLCR